MSSLVTVLLLPYLFTLATSLPHRHAHPSHSPTPKPTPPFIIVDLPPSPAPRLSSPPSPSVSPRPSPSPPIPRPTPQSTMSNNDTTTAAVNAQSIEGVRTPAITLNYLVPTLAVIICGITLAILYTYANNINPYRPYVTGASLSDYSLPGYHRHAGAAAQSRRYHATSLDPNAVPVPQVPPPPATLPQPRHQADVREPGSAGTAVPTAPAKSASSSRARSQLDENELSFARRNDNASPAKPR